MIAVDANAVVALLVDDAELGALSRRQYALHDLAAPEILHYEVMSVLRKLSHIEVLSKRAAEHALHDLGLLRISTVPFGDIAQRMWDLRDDLSPCDASYVAVAELFDVELLTFDSRVRNAPGVRCAFLDN